jgi:hypothetical protein
MGVYLGYVIRDERSDGRAVLYRFRPIAEKSNLGTPLSNDDLERLLPESDYRDILFAHEYRNERLNMVTKFGNKSFVLFEFSETDIENNANTEAFIKINWKNKSANQRYSPGYKVEEVGANIMNAESELARRIRRTQEDKIYRLIENEDIFDENGGILSISMSPILTGEEVFVERDDCYEGPYIIKSIDGTENTEGTPLYYIDMGLQQKQNNYIIGKYEKGVCIRGEFNGRYYYEENEDSTYNLKVFMPEENAELRQVDVIDDEILLESFCEVIENVNINRGKIVSTDIAALLERYKNSVLGCSDISDEIRSRRHEHLIRLILGEKERYDEISNIIEGICHWLRDHEAISSEAKWLKAFIESHSDLIDQMENLHIVTKKIERMTKCKQKLETEIGDLESQFQQLLNKQKDKMVEMSFDGFMSSKLIEAATKWETEKDISYQENLFEELNALTIPDKTPEELVEYLCRMVQIVRPTYDKNTIVNIAICITQGFLTVFSGEPGCGKTSICNIFGEVLGLNKIGEDIDAPEDMKETAKRYIPVSVERGWTSKRDFVGYYNPLSKTFDKSNRRVYDALYQLDREKKEGSASYPYIILLDEANLSPMEYYWSDFMNVCDDLGPQSSVNLGEDYIFSIPETLHFLATINNDDTTERLSPRLLDRAWVVSLPQQTEVDAVGANIPRNQVEIITWASLRNAFIPKREDYTAWSEVKDIYNSIVELLGEMQISVSPRIEKAIKRYWVAAAKYFQEDEAGTKAELVALDYAIAQKILPKIKGDGEKFEKLLEKFKMLCGDNGMIMSEKLTDDIISFGNRQMKYYQFFF